MGPRASVLGIVPAVKGDWWSPGEAFAATLAVGARYVHFWHGLLDI